MLPTANRMGWDEGGERRGIVCLQPPTKTTLQGLETTCNSSAGDSHGKGLPQAGAAPTLHSDEFCLLSASCKERKRAEMASGGAN